MTTCIKCGRAVPDGELFCDACSLGIFEPEQTEERVSGHRHGEPSQGQMKKPVKVPNTGPTHPVSTPVPVRARGGWIAAVCVLMVLVLGLTALNAYQFFGLQGRRTELRVQQSRVEEQQEAFQDMELSLSRTEDELAQASQTIAEQQEQIRQLQQGMDTAESSASQNQYDLNAQKQELEKQRAENDRLLAEAETLVAEKEALKTENKALTEEKDTLEDQVETLSQSVAELTARSSTLSKKSDFMDKYVVFVENDKSGLYHHYGCAAFAQKSFWAYSRKLAENSGFHPCPVCFPD